MEGKPTPNPQKKPNPKAAGAKEKAAPKEKSGGNKGLVIFLVIVILALAGGLGYMITKNNQLEDEKEQQASEFSDKETDYKKQVSDLDAQVTAKIEELKKLAEERDGLQLDNDDLKKSIEEITDYFLRTENSIILRYITVHKVRYKKLEYLLDDELKLKIQSYYKKHHKDLLPPSLKA